MRKIHVQNLNKQKWDFDINVYSNGPDYTSLVLVSQAFESKVNVQQIRELIQNYAFRLRFKNVHFRSYREIETYDTNSAIDNEL